MHELWACCLVESVYAFTLVTFISRIFFQVINRFLLTLRCSGTGLYTTLPQVQLPLQLLRLPRLRSLSPLLPFKEQEYYQ